MRTTITALALAFGVSLAVAAPALAAETLHGQDGPGKKITLTYDGTKVSKLSPGAYTVVVKDDSTRWDFRLTGPGVSKSTTDKMKGTATWHVTLKKGTYTYVAGPGVSHTFTVT
jgi:hypothetical protein